MKNIFFLIVVFLIFSCKKKEAKKDENWFIVNDKNKIPQQIIDFFEAAENRPFEMANPDEEFNITDNVVNPSLPFRQLRLLENKNEIWRMVYLQGGIGESYQFYEFRIHRDTISNSKKAYSFENIETNDSLEYYIKNGKVKFEKIKLKYKWID